MSRPDRWQVRNNLHQNITPDKVFINTMHLRIKQFHYKKYAKHKRLILVSLQYRWLQTSGELKPDRLRLVERPLPSREGSPFTNRGRHGSGILPSAPRLPFKQRLYRA